MVRKQSLVGTLSSSIQDSWTMGLAGTGPSLMCQVAPAEGLGQQIPQQGYNPRTVMKSRSQNDLGPASST